MDTRIPRYSSALVAAACWGETEIAKFLVDRGADVSAMDKSGATALMEASSHRHLEAVRLLLPCCKSVSYIKGCSIATNISVIDL